MQHPDQARALFFMQSELIDTKIDASVNKSINKVVEQIVSLRQELKQELHEFKVDVGQRLAAVETALGMRNQIRSELRTRFFDYSFRAGWVLLLALPGLVASAILLARSF